MNSKAKSNIETAELVLPCEDFDKTLEFFTERLGFKINVIFPADNPAVASIFGYGLSIRLEKSSGNFGENKNIKLRLECNSPENIADGESELTAPNGVKIELIDANPPLDLPEVKQTFVHTKLSENAEWIKGRAGMRYRDLIPDRQGGRFIASHIHIPQGGEVPDYVHFHKIRFQIIYCYKGWAKLVYEDQGESFIFKAGDCVLQPPQIRHRVLESSDNLEVIEIGCPAEHETFADHETNLPTNLVDSLRDFGGQRFVHYAADQDLSEKRWRLDDLLCRTTGIKYATNGLADVKTVWFIQPNADSGFEENSAKINLTEHDAEFVFFFILQGKANLRRENNTKDSLERGDALTIPAGMKYSFTECSKNFKMLEVTLPADIRFKEF